MDRTPVVEYRADIAGLTADHLAGGFFEGWPDPPTPDGHLRHLHGCEAVELAVDRETGDVVGFCSAIGDGGTVAFIPLLEVLPAWRGRGIGTALVRRMLDRLADRYAIDLVCDDDVVAFYERAGGVAGRAMMWRPGRTTAAPAVPAEQDVNTP